MNLNKVLLIGNITRDPELRTTPSGQSVVHITVATNRIYFNKDKERLEEVEFHDVVLWSRLAEIASQYLKKGSKVYIEGRLRTRSWEDQAGIKRYRTEIIAEQMIMLDKRPQTPPTPTPTPTSTPTPTPTPTPTTTPTTPSQTTDKSEDIKVSSSTPKSQSIEDIENLDVEKQNEQQTSSEIQNKTSNSFQSNDLNENNEEIKFEEIPF